MTVFVYVTASKQIGDKDHVRVFANVDAGEKWFEENDPEGVAFEYEVLELTAGPQAAGLCSAPILVLDPRGADTGSVPYFGNTVLLLTSDKLSRFREAANG
jgi:hypothetical protein